jgi:Zinc carboxypeptidase
VGGASSNPCSITFAGPSPYSEVEIQHLVDYYVSILSQVDVYLSFHSYSQFLLTPLGTTNDPVHNQHHLLQIGNAAATALAKRHGTQYTVGNWLDVLCE